MISSIYQKMRLKTALIGSFLLLSTGGAMQSAYAANCTDLPASGGRYYIVNESSGKVLDVSGYSSDDGAVVHQWPNLSAQNQQWDVTDLGNGSWSIRAVHSNKSLDVSGWSTNDGAAIHQWSYTGYVNQQWKIDNAGSSFKISSVYSNLLMTVDGTENGSKLYQSIDKSSASQRWFFNPVNGVCRVPQPVSNSAGCGSSPKMATGLQSTIIDGVSRNYWIEMPANYDPNKAYPLIMGLHWRGGSASEIYGWNDFFGLKTLYNGQAIFLAPQGLDAGWANTGDRDIRFMRAMINNVQQSVCTDTKQVFATGFSFGGMMSNAIGCQMGDQVRAIVPMGSALWSGCAESSEKVAALFVHAKDDTTVPYSAGEEARAVFLARNHCSANTVSLGNNGCVEYQGCDSDKPVVWCGTETGGHWYPNFSAQESKAFFDRFK